MRPNSPPTLPAIGIIMLDTAFPRIPGDVGNPATFPFPVLYHTVSDASPQRVVREADHTLLASFIAAARHLEGQGVRAIATSCGFLAIFQRQLAASVSIPVYTSALLQIGLARSIMGAGRQVGILTADRASLTARHFAGVGIDDPPDAIAGMDPAGEFAAVFLGGKPVLNRQRCCEEMVIAAKSLVAAHSDVGSLVLECTNMPPYSAAVQTATGLPVFDVVTLIQLAHQAAMRPAFGRCR